MPNHFHRVLWLRDDGDLARFREVEKSECF
jgi:hypothetical protein